MSSVACEWVYEIIFHLPFGWKIIRLRPKVKKYLGDQYKSPMLYKKIEIRPGTFREKYWPETYLKHYRGDKT